MQEQDIDFYLALLGQELHQQGLQQPLRILLVGGAFMLTQLHNRPTTNDVDVLLKDITDSTASPLYHTFQAAVRAVASKNKIPRTWLNDVIGDFLRDASRVPEGTFWRRYTLLDVYIPSKEYILALKLLAGRQKDQEDIEALCRLLHIHTRHQAQRTVDQYIPDKQVQSMNNLEETLDTFFP